MLKENKREENKVAWKINFVFLKIRMARTLGAFFFVFCLFSKKRYVFRFRLLNDIVPGAKINACLPFNRAQMKHEENTLESVELVGKRITLKAT